MHFKPAGKKVQVMAYRGYDKKKKRSSIRMIGSIGNDGFTPTDALRDSITADERDEIQAYINSVRLMNEKKTNSTSFDTLPDVLEQCLTAIHDGDATVTREWAENVWKNLDELGRALRKSGYGKKKTINTKKAGA